MGRFPHSALYTGRVMHRRYHPVRHRLSYRVFFLLLDLDALDDLDARLRLFAHNRFGILGFHDSDHGPGDGTPLRPWIDGELRKAGLFHPGGRVLIACFPRMWGYVFNPLSVYYCYDAADRLVAVLHEVRNTFGQRHGYLLPVAPGAGEDGGPIRQTVAKDFHVSPFITMDARYDFRLNAPGDRVTVAIANHFDGGLGLSAVLSGKRVALSDGAIAVAVTRHPLMTLKVMAAIHWHALRLWLKGVPLVRKPAAPATAVTVGGISAVDQISLSTRRS